MTDEISWNDLDSAERFAIAVLGAGISIEVCDCAAVETLKRAGLVRGDQLTPQAKHLRKAAVRSLPFAISTLQNSRHPADRRMRSVVAPFSCEEERKRWLLL